jgi:hypothetical protein
VRRVFLMKEREEGREGEREERREEGRGEWGGRSLSQNRGAAPYTG